jgi:hypothetical protein
MDNRDTLREFSLKTTNDKGVQFDIRYGYDLSKATPTFYVNASINGAAPSSNKKTLDRVQKLGIEPINRLIELIGCDETGVSSTFDADAIELLLNYLDRSNNVSVQTIARYLKIDSDSKEVAKLTTALERIQTMRITGKTEKAILAYYTRFVDAYRLGYLMNVREVTQSLRKLYYKGIEINGKRAVVRMEGYLKNNHYPTYYKRDIDLIRASRIRIYQHILKKPYKAVER